jgi:hypothetical protein
MQEQSIQQTTVTIKQLCKSVGFSRSTLHRAIASNKIRVIRYGRSVRIPSDEAQKIIARGW